MKTIKMKVGAFRIAHTSICFAPTAAAAAAGFTLSRGMKRQRKGNDREEKQREKVCAARCEAKFDWR